MIQKLIRDKLESTGSGEDVPFTVEERRLVLRELNWHNSADGEFLYDIFAGLKEPSRAPYDFVFHLDELLRE